MVTTWFQSPLASNSQSCSVPQAEGPALKKIKYEDCSAIDLSTSRRSSGNEFTHASLTPEKSKKAKEGVWPDDHPEAKKITNQVYSGLA